MTYYSQWSKDRKLSSIVWVCGSERVLVEEIVQHVKNSRTFSALDSAVLDASQLTESQLWDELYQRPIVEDSNRLVLVYGSQEISDFTRMREWVRDFPTCFPTTVVCFISDDDAPPETTFLKPPKVTVVKCSKLSQEDCVRWVKSISPLSERSSRAVLDHVAGSLEDAQQVCNKIKRSMGSSPLVSLTNEQIKSFIAETPSEFTDALLSLDKQRAFVSINYMSDDEKYRAVSILESRLSQLSKLQRILRTSKPTGQELSKIPGIQVLQQFKNTVVQATAHSNRLLSQ
jgi:DNA polymerase III delta subunit